MKLVNLNKKLFLAVFVLGLLTAAGCSAPNSAEDHTNNIDTTEFGISDGETGSKTVYLVNKTGQNIIGLSAWPVGAEFGSDTLLGQDQIINNEQQSSWNLPEYSADQSKYYIQVTLEDGTNFILRDVDFETLPENGQITVNYKDQTGYLTYVNTDNEEVDTFDWEISQKDQPYEEFIDDSNEIIGIPVDD